MLDTSPLGPIIRRRQGPDSPLERVSALLLAACGATEAEIAAVKAGAVLPGVTG